MFFLVEKWDGFFVLSFIDLFCLFFILKSVLIWKNGEGLKFIILCFCFIRSLIVMDCIWLVDSLFLIFF